MVRDAKTKACYRADHVLKAALEAQAAAADITAEKKKELELTIARIDDMKEKEIQETIAKYGVKAPGTGNDLTEPRPFNLMFSTSIGPTGDLAGFLRPETAQGIFVNFKRVLDYNGGRVPFAVAQVGQAFRNEIAPRSGLLRVREFTLAEIEYFVNPKSKDHVNYEHEVVEKKAEIPLLSAKRQLEGCSDPVVTSVADAVAQGVIHNKALGYFMSRTFLFLVECGVHPEHIRFRQHLPSEMAHYASDCWDAEIRTTYGWIECVGHADRTCFDLERHQNGSKVSMTVHESFKEPKIVKRYVPKVEKGAIGKKYRKEAQPIIKALTELGAEESEKYAKEMEASGKIVMKVGDHEAELDGTMVSFKFSEEKVTGDVFIPHVIEPSFGIGRILYCLLEHAFWHRPEDADRGVLSLPPFLAPYKVSVFPLQQDKKLQPVVHEIDRLLSKNGISHRVDETGQTIGKRYARTDEVGIPFAITVDYESLEGEEGARAVTLRERDTCKQVRIPVKDLCAVIASLSNHDSKWEEVAAKYPAVTQDEN